MGLFKALVRSDAVRRPLCWSVAQYLRFVHGTTRWQVLRGELASGKWDRGEPFILALWHGRLLMMPFCWRPGVPFRMLISNHPDGQIISRAIGYIGIGTVAGSSSKGGGAAMRQMLRSLKSGVSIGITPDGPRGPRMRASDGVVQAARISGMPIVPCSYATSRGRLLGTWDRFLLARPFARGVFVWGEAINVPADASTETIEAARRAVEESLNALTAEADALVGRESPEPAPAPVTP